MNTSWSRWLKRIFKSVALLLGTFVFLVALLLAGFFFVPKIEISSSRLESLAQAYLPEDLELKWGDALVRILRTGALSKEIEFRFKDICVAYQGETLNACFANFEWGAEFTVANLNPRITFFAPLVATGGRVRGDIDKLTREDESAPPLEPGGFSAVDFLRTELLPKWRIDGSLVELDSLRLKVSAQTLSTQLRLATAATGASRMATLKIKDFEWGPEIRANLDGEVDWPRHESAPFTVKADVDALLPGRRGIDSRIEGSVHAWNHVDYDLLAKFSNVPAIREGRLQGTYRGDNLKGVVAAKFGALGAQVKTLDFVGCDYELALDVKEAAVTCGPQTVVLGLQERAQLRNRKLFRLFPTFDLRVANLTWDNGVQADWKFALDLSHLKTAEINLDLSGTLLRRGATDVSDKILRYTVDGDAVLRVLEFGKIVELLRPTLFALPAPVNRLRGPIEMSASGGFSEQGGELPFEVRTRLSSLHQKLRTSVSGRVDLVPTVGGLTPSLLVDVALEDVQLSLPRIEVTSSLPRLLPDPRFKRGLADDPPPPEATPGPSLNYRVRVKTSAPGQLKIATNVTGAPIPITVRYRIRSAPETVRIRRAAAVHQELGADEAESKTQMEGTVSLGRTPVDIGGINKAFARLERDAVLDHFDLQLLPDGTRKIDGKFVVTNPDATVSILVLGTLHEPTIRFESNPPATENQIIAALLFGRPINEFDEGEQQSAAAFRTAVNDTALTLAQMYLLANSPIDSLNYDSESGRVIASVKIAGGTSLEFGGARGAGSEVGIRRRLARNVYLNTYVERAAQTDEQLVSAFVEWVRRF